MMWSPTTVVRLSVAIGALLLAVTSIVAPSIAGPLAGSIGRYEQFVQRSPILTQAPEANDKANVGAEAEAETESKTNAKGKGKVEVKAKREDEAKAKREAEAKTKREAEAKTKREAEAKTKREAEAKAKGEAEARTKREAEATAKREAEARKKREAEAKTKRKAKRKARDDAATKAKTKPEIFVKDKVEAGTKSVNERRQDTRTEQAKPRFRADEIGDVLRRAGLSDIQVTDSELPRYVAEACDGNHRVRVRLNRNGAVTKRENIGRCGPAAATKIDTGIRPGQIKDILGRNGYRRIDVVDRELPTYVAEACKNKRAYRIQLNRLGEIIPLFVG